MARPHRSDVAADRTHERRSPSATLRWIAAAGALLGAMLYSNWLLEMAFTRSLPDPDLFISELAATDQPHGEWFRGCDLAAAVILLVAAAAALVGIRRDRWSRTGWWALAVFAVTTALDSTVWTLVCAPSSDASCATREATGAVPIGHQLHLLSSVVGVLAAIVSLFAFVVVDLRQRPPGRRVGLFLLAALIATSVWTTVAVAIDSATGIGAAEVGIAQRVQLIAIAGWLIFVAVRRPCTGVMS